MEASLALVLMLLSFIAPEAEGVVLDDVVALELITQWGRLGYFVCDGVVLVLSPERRSLSDYLAGTAVIVVAPATVRALEERPDIPRRFADPEPPDSAGEPEDDQPYDGGPLLVLADGRLFSCPDCARKVNFGASECQGCSERFRYQNGQVFLDD
jgi:hypothetical protein